MTFLRADRSLFLAAAHERAVACEHGPAQVRAGKVSQEELDVIVEAWTVLAALLPWRGAAKAVDTPLTWDRIERVVADNLRRREADFAGADPDARAAVRHRRDAVRAVSDFLVAERALRAGQRPVPVAA